MIAGLVGLLAWIGYQVWDKERRAPGNSAPLIKFTVDGLDCPFWCAVRLTEAIDGLNGAHVETWDRFEGTVVVRHDPARQDVETLRLLIEEAGFPVLEMDATR